MVERVCKIDQDLGDGSRLQLCVTNELFRFNKTFKVRHEPHPILGVKEEEVAIENVPSAPTLIPPPPLVLPPLPARKLIP